MNDQMTAAIADTREWSRTLLPTLDDGLVGLLVDAVEALASSVDAPRFSLVSGPESVDYRDFGEDFVSFRAVFWRTEDWNSAVNPDPVPGAAVLSRLQTAVAQYLRVAAVEHQSSQLGNAATKLERSPADLSAQTEVQLRLGGLITEAIEGATRARFGAAPSARGGD